MRHRKVRGNNKKFEEMKFWIANNKELDIEYLESYKMDYCKVWVNPWGIRISLTNSNFPQPTGKLKHEIISGLNQIYTHWKKQLDDLGKPTT